MLKAFLMFVSVLFLGCAGTQKAAVSANAASCKRDALAIIRASASCQSALSQLFELMQDPRCASIVRDPGKPDAVQVGDVTLTCHEEPASLEDVDPGIGVRWVVTVVEGGAS